MSRAPSLVRPTGPEARQGEPDRDPIEGDCWQGDELNRLVPQLERNGWSVIPGTLGHAGLSVIGRSGARTRLDLVRPGVILATSEDGLPTSDQFPLLHLYRGDEPRHQDLDRVDAIVSDWSPAWAAARD